MFAKLFSKKDKEKKEDKKAPGSPASPEPEKLTKDDFESLDVLGKGSFAYVVLAKRKNTNNYYAMKVVNKQGLIDHKRIQDVFTERNILTRLTHPYLLKLHYTFQSDHKLFFVMDYMPGGDLDKYMNSQPNKMLDPFTAKLYGMQVLSAILCLHEHGVIYRDLKPENILLSAEGHCALADFGLSKDFNKELGAEGSEELRANSFVGSPFYVAPDVLKQKEYHQAVDFWSFGILLYRMLCGRCPFNGKNMKEVFDNILYSELRFPSSVTLSPEAKDLISRLLIKDAAKRIKGPDVRAHPYWSDMSWDDVMKKKVKPPQWTPMPSPEEVVRMRQENPPPAVSSKQGVEVVNTPAQSKQIAPTEQTRFEGFSMDAQGQSSVLRK